MGQKVHPKGFRLGFTQEHLSNWYASPKDYAKYVIQDNELRQKLSLEGVSKIEIRRVPGQILASGLKTHVSASRLPP